MYPSKRAYTKVRLAAAQMEAEHVAKAEAEQKAHQEGTSSLSSCHFFVVTDNTCSGCEDGS